MRKVTVTTSTWDDESYRNECEPDASNVDVEVHENPTPIEVVDLLRKLGVEFKAVSWPASPSRNVDGVVYADASLPDGCREYYGSGMSNWVAVPVPMVEEVAVRVEGFSELTTRVIMARVDARPVVAQH